jgi:hypothetical protein
MDADKVKSKMAKGMTENTQQAINIEHHCSGMFQSAFIGVHRRLHGFQ